MLGKSTKWFVVFVFLLMSLGLGSGSGIAQEKLPAVGGVDDSTMGPYRALAEMGYSAFQKGQFADATKILRVLEMVWNRDEVKKEQTSIDYQQIHRSMLGLMMVIANRELAPPNEPISEEGQKEAERAYRQYLEDLGKIDKRWWNPKYLN